METPKEMFQEQDKYDILDMIGELIEPNVNDTILAFSKPSFHDTLYTTVYDQSIILLKNIFTEEVIRDEIEELVVEALKTYFMYICPKRSYRTKTVKHDPKVCFIKQTLDYLSSIPQPAQRTEEWYTFRHNYLTASSIWKAFSTESNRNQLIYSKCIPLDTTKYSKINLESPMHWGQKYEDVSLQWYELNYNTRVSDFGCIPHRDIPFVAASPDGINTDPHSDRYGRMVEVKNIVNRDITGIPKEEYWIQMQIQLEVCNLTECDFLETRFKEYEDQEAFIEDGNRYNISEDGKQKGIMSLFLDKEGQPIYEYAPLHLTESVFITWNEEIMNKHENWLKHIYWKLDEVSVVLVVKNKKWLEAAKPILKDIWDIIVKEKKEGYDHRSPKKRQRIKSKPEVMDQKCLITIDTN